MLAKLIMISPKVFSSLACLKWNEVKNEPVLVNNPANPIFMIHQAKRQGFKVFHLF